MTAKTQDTAETDILDSFREAMEGCGGKSRIARKAHRCRACVVEIAKSEVYIETYEGAPDTFHPFRLHVQCLRRWWYGDDEAAR
jgi:uncharacterized protein with PIN domain